MQRAERGSASLDSTGAACNPAASANRVGRVINTSLFTDFLHLVQSRNFSTTARERGMSQSTLSRRIMQLEAFVGAPLFDRSIQPVSLTAAGEKLLPMAQDLSEQLDLIRQIGHPGSQGGTEICNMIALSTLAMEFFPGWLSSHDRPGRPWRVNLLNTEPLLIMNINNFLRGQSEFLLTFAADHVADLHALRHHRYIVLGEDRACPVSAPGPDGAPLWALGTEDPVPYCAYTRGSFFQQALAPAIERLGARLRPVRDNSMAAVLYSMVRQGHGMGWLPELQVREAMATGGLVRAGGPEFDLLSEIRLYRSHNLSRYAMAFWNRVSAGYEIRRKELRLA